MIAAASEAQERDAYGGERGRADGARALIALTTQRVREAEPAKNNSSLSVTLASDACHHMQAKPETSAGIERGGTPDDRRCSALWK